MKNPPKQKKLGIAKNKLGASTITGYSENQIKQARDGGCLAFKSNNNINCQQLVDWFLDHGIEPEVDDYNLNIERVKTSRVKRALDQQKLDERAGRLIPVDKVQAFASRNNRAAKSRIYIAENSIAVELSMRFGMSVEDVRVITSKHLRLAIKELREGQWGKVLCEGCGKEQE